jgi:hypothetical protein
MIKKGIILFLVLMYQYTLMADIFLNSYFKLPAPLLFGVPLILFFAVKKYYTVEFGWETFFFLAANLLYYAVGQGDFKPFIVNSITFIVCMLYFKSFIGDNNSRFKVAIFLFFMLLGISVCIMLVNHLFPQRVDSLRSTLLGSQVTQSPTGISTTIFTFGYQLAAFTSFTIVAAFLWKRSMFLPVVALLGCLIAAWYGMQRSALIAFGMSVIGFTLFYYKQRAIPILSATLVCCLLFFLLVLKPYASSSDNILDKTNRNTENGENRSELFIENLKIYSEYPFGLVFYGKQWKDAIVGSYVFSSGITSHNAYMMFFTYLGPFVGIALLLGLYYPAYKAFKYAALNIRKPQNKLFVALCFSLLAISINSLFHNAWLVNANGPTVFLYVAILHKYDLNTAV